MHLVTYTPKSKWSMWLQNFKHSKRQLGHEGASQTDASLSPPNKNSYGLDNPLYNFYQHKMKTNLTSFYRFALQSRSLDIRDTFAKVASYGRESLGDLLAVLEARSQSANGKYQLSDIRDLYDCEMLLALADLLANSARNDSDTHAALQLYDFANEVYGPEYFKEHNRLQYVEALGEAERYNDLRLLCERFDIEELDPLQCKLLGIQQASRLSQSSKDWLSATNSLYTQLGMASIRLLDDDSLPLLDRLASDTNQRIDGPRVSVIMPTYSPGPGIRTAIRGLLEQTWENLEIIIVDDASPETYHPVFAELEGIDSRITVIRQSENSGAYVARNAGLSMSTGEFVTTHDDDDWSHPDKIARQVNEMLQNPELVGTTSSHIRVTPDLEFRRMNMQAKFMQMNYSSLLFRKNIVDEIGNWDTVNRGGDSEFLTRIIENFGSDKVAHQPEEPLSFSRVWSGSLTSGEMSRGYFANSRLLYRWAFRQWHWNSTKLGKRAIRYDDKPRQYPIPTTFQAGDRNKDLGVFDVIYVTDYFRQSKFVNTVLQDIEGFVERGLRVGYLHLHSPQTNRFAGIPQRLFDLQLEGRVTQVSHDDVAETKLLIVFDAAIGMFLDGLESKVVSRRALVVDHELPFLSAGEKRTATLMGQTLLNLDGCFSSHFEVVGSTKHDQERLRNQVPATRLLPDHLIWNIHASRGPGQISPPSGVPIVGFHSYGNQYRWPSNDAVFSDVYVSRNFETRLFGHLTPARQRFSESSLGQVSMIHFEDQKESDFLESIDFWVYYPHDRLQDRIWGPVISAMRAGKVVILPKRLEPLYGTAAVYADLGEIDETILELAGDQDLYTHCAKRGQNFVESFYTLEQLYQRYDQLVVSS